MRFNLASFFDKETWELLCIQTLRKFLKRKMVFEIVQGRKFPVVRGSLVGFTRAIFNVNYFINHFSFQELSERLST